MRSPANHIAPVAALTAWTLASLPAMAATNTDWIDAPDNRGTETAPINLYDKTKWTSGALPSSDYNLNFTAAGRTYVTNTTTKKIATALRFGGGEFVVFGPMTFSSFDYVVDNNFAETAPVVIDKRGDWECTGYFWPAAGDGASFVLTNRTGNLTTGASDYAGRLGNGNNSTAVLVLESGNFSCPSATMQFSLGYGEGSTARFEQNGGTSTFGARLQIAFGSGSTGTFELNGGTAYVTSDLYVGRSGAGTLTVNNGTFTVGGVSWLGANGGSSKGTLNLNGGTFGTSYIRLPESNGGGTILFDGGTLKATGVSGKTGGLIQDNGRILVRVGARGGTIDTAGLSINYAKNTATADGVESDGGLAIVGGGALTVTGSATDKRFEFNGRTTIAVGTHVTLPTSKVGGGVTFTIPAGLARGLYVPLAVSVDGYTLEEVFASAVLPNDPDARFELSPDKKKILCYYKMDGLSDPYWIGGATGNLGDAANWSTGSVPQGGTCYIGADGAAVTLTSSASFRPDSITFLEGSKSVTITGTDDIAGISTVTSLSAVNHTINVPVRFADKIRVVQPALSYNSRAKAHVVFAGGAYGTTPDPDCSRFIAGHYFLSDTTGAWTATGYQNETMYGLQKGSSISAPYLTNISQFFSGGTDADEDGGAVTTGVYQTSARICRFNQGTAEFVVTNEVRFTLTGNNHLAYRYSNGWFKFEKFTICAASGDYTFYFANSADYYYAKNVRIGAGGIGFESGLAKSPLIQFGRRSGDVTTLAPWHSDFTVGTKGQTGKSDLAFASKTTTVFDTTDENGIGRTITLDALCGNVGPVNVTGKGTVVVNNRANTCSGAVTVKDTATLALNAGCPFGTGRVTVNDGATLKANASGTVAFASNVVCQAGAALAFRFTEKQTAPCLAFNAGVAGNAMPETLAIRLSAADGLVPGGRRHVLTTGYDFSDTELTLVDPPDWVQSVGKDASGNLVLEVKSYGIAVIIR